MFGEHGKEDSPRKGFSLWKLFEDASFWQSASRHHTRKGVYLSTLLNRSGKFSSYVQGKGRGEGNSSPALSSKLHIIIIFNK